jgi:hypothetical protein
MLALEQLIYSQRGLRNSILVIGRDGAARSFTAAHHCFGG